MKYLIKAVLLILFISTTNLGLAQIQLKIDTPPINSEIFAPYLISTKQKQRDLAISPDGTEIYYTVFENGLDGNIYFIKKTGDLWSAPSIASFSGGKQDLEPAFGDNGNKLFFSSKRGGASFDIYYSEKAADGSWGTAKSVGSPINTSVNEFYPSVANDGSIYFTANYDHGAGGEDIWYSKYLDGTYQTPISLPNVNTATDEFNAYVDPDEKFIYFGSFGRADGLGGGDIYTSTNNNGAWSSGRNLGTSVNTGGLDYSPFVSPDGRILFFTSQRISAITERSNNPFDLEAVVNSLLAPKGVGSDIYWKKR